MRKNIFIALSACVALAACTKNEVRPVVADQQITFQAVVNKPSTKAMIDNTAYPITETFGSVAYKVDASSSAELYIPVSEVKYGSTTGESTTTFWTTDTPYYWPKETGSTLTFFSYSPYNYSETPASPISVTHASDGLTFTDYSVKEHQQTDLMVADKVENQTKNTTTNTGGWTQKGVPTVFHHKLAQIVGINFQTFSATSDTYDYAHGHTSGSYVAGDKQFVIKEIGIKNFYEQGTLVTSTDTWTPTGSVTDSYTWSNTDITLSSGSATSSSFYLILPQSHSAEGAKLYVKYQILTYTDSSNHATETIEVTTPFSTIHGTGAKWEMNKKYTYTLKMSLDRIYWDPTVTNWQDETISATI